MQQKYKFQQYTNHETKYKTSIKQNKKILTDKSKNQKTAAYQPGDTE